MTDLPERPVPGALPEQRRLSNRDFELVIRRAAELQAREAEDLTTDGIEEGEVLRIGRELGLSSQHLHRALVEVTGNETAEAGALTKVFGPATVRAGRTVRGEPAHIAATLERHLVEIEYLAVLRRMYDRVLYTRATGWVAGLGRAWSEVVSRSPLLSVSNLEVATHPLEEGYSYVHLGTELNKDRTSAAVASFLGGGSGTAVTAATLGIAIAPPAAVLALPLLGVSVWGAQVYCRNLRNKVQIQLEFLLDRLEHGELERKTKARSLPWV